MKDEHSKIINKVAKQKLKPLGIVQKGKSRLWLDDRTWFTTVIEFQPSSWAKGAYLNIGANFHWHKKEYLSFDLGYRRENFVEYRNNEQFTTAMENFCDLIIQRVLEIREKLATLSSAKENILKHSFSCEETWGNYHKGTICGLTGSFDELNKFYGDLLNVNSTVQAVYTNKGVVDTVHIKWIDELKENVEHLLTKTTDLNLFKSEILNIIIETRRLKKLPEVEISI
jgi:hypothetical protein